MMRISLLKGENLFSPGLFALEDVLAVTTLSVRKTAFTFSSKLSLFSVKFMEYGDIYRRFQLSTLKSLFPLYPVYVCIYIIYTHTSEIIVIIRVKYQKVN